jgi:L-alanine-DL-glutamate epimerase-like enolase superfamily enzyme
MMIDVCYGWTNAKEALRTMRQLEPYDNFFMETPLPVDDIDGLAYLHDHSPLSRAAVLALHFLCNWAMSGHHGPSGFCPDSA